MDTAALLGTIFGVAASLGIGVVQLNFGLRYLFGVPENLAVPSALTALGVLMAVASCVWGVDKGIRRLSELSIILAIGLMLYVLITGRTAFLLDAIVKGVSGLRVADASVISELATVNPKITVFMIGERAAELIVQDRDTTAH